LLKKNNMLSKKIVNNWIWLILENILSKILFVFIIFYLTKELWQEDFWKFNFLASFIFFFTVLADFGLAPFIIREVWKKNINWLKLFNIGIFQIFFIVISFLLLFIYVNLSSFWIDINIVYIFSIYYLNYIFINNIRNIFRWFNKTIFDFIISSLLNIILVLAIIFFLPKDLLSLSYLYLIVSIIWIILSSIILYVYYIKKNNIKINLQIDLNYIRFILKESFPFMIWIMAVAIYFKIDIVMIWHIKSMSDVAIYSMAYNFIFLATSFLIIWMESVYPFLSAEKNTLGKIQIFNKYYIYLLIITIFWIIFLYLFGLSFVEYIFWSEYSNSFIILQVLLISLVFFSYNKFIFYLLSSINKQKVYSYIVITWAFINFVLNLFFIKEYGITWAAYATLITELAIYTILSIYIYKYYQLIKQHILIILLISILLFFSIYISLYYIIWLAPIIYIIYNWLNNKDKFL
jgi:O-antigen/teichoic acid export membrane protein